MMNSHTKKNKGFAFLQFATVEQAKRACTELKNPLVNGKECGVSPSQDNDTLFLGNICKTWTKEALEEKLKHYGVDNIEDLTLVEDTNNEGMNRGFAFVEFCSHSEAMYAFKRLQKRNVTFGVDRPAKVSFEDSFIHPGDEIMAQVDDVHPRYAEAGVRHSHAHLDYEVASGSGSQYGDAYGDRRLGRSNLGCGGNRSSLSGQDSHRMYRSRQGMGYGGGGMFSSSYGSDYMSRGSDVECSRPAMEVITCLVAAMLTQFILVVVWVAVVIWEVVVLDLTTKI
ncbi:hypothetical protein P3L10_028018 [Capsicum annuum]